MCVWLRMYRVLPYMFVGDIFMIPDDPFGKDGPMLEEVLNKNAKPAQAQRNLVPA